MKHFYVYYSYEPWGRGYIGKRECDCLPEEDVTYFGSYRDKTFKPTEKIVLETFNTLSEVLEAEILLHEFYQVDKNPHFANRAKATSTAFYFSASGKDNPFISKALLALGDDHPSKSEKFKESIKKHYEINGHPWTGRKHNEESKEKMRINGKGKNKGTKHTEERKNKLKNSKCKYIYTLISPEGEIFETINANQFCKDNNLTDIGIYRVVNGKQNNHKGWTASRRPIINEDK